MTTYFVVVAAHTKIFVSFPHFVSKLLKKNQKNKPIMYEQMI